MSLKLEEMEAADMLDVLHYMFEEDVARLTTAEQSDAVSAMRTTLYGLYNKPYRYGTKSSGSSSSGRQYVSGDYDFKTDVPFDPASQAPKPFVPATDFNPESSMPFGSVLDAPLG